MIKRMYWNCVCESDWSAMKNVNQYKSIIFYLRVLQVGILFTFFGEDSGTKKRLCLELLPRAGSVFCRWNKESILFQDREPEGKQATRRACPWQTAIGDGTIGSSTAHAFYLFLSRSPSVKIQNRLRSRLSRMAFWAIEWRAAFFEICQFTSEQFFLNSKFFDLQIIFWKKEFDTTGLSKILTVFLFFCGSTHSNREAICVAFLL